MSRENQWVSVARLGRAWGKRGELAAASLTSRPERFQQLDEVFLIREGARVRTEAVRVESVREHGRGWIFKFRGVDTISDAELLERADVCVPQADRLPLPDGEHYLSDLIGCEVRGRRTNEMLGTVTGWIDAGGPGLLEISHQGTQLLVPFARSICVAIDTHAKRIVVDLPDGLKDLNRP